MKQKIMKHIKLFENFNESDNNSDNGFYYKSEYDKYTTKEHTDEYFNSMKNVDFTTEDRILVIEKTIDDVEDTKTKNEEDLISSRENYEKMKKQLVDNPPDLEDKDIKDKEFIMKLINDELDKRLKHYENIKKYINNWDYRYQFEQKLMFQKSAYGIVYKMVHDKHREESMKRTLSKSDFIDLFVTALEGGSNHWYKLNELDQEITDNVEQYNMTKTDAIGDFILNGGSVNFYDLEDNDFLGKVDMLSILDCVKILKKDYSEVWENILMEDYDADDSDVFLQICVMGEIVYG